MAFDLALTSTMSGVTESQLRRWARDGLLVPEVSESNPHLYSFRDVLALRACARLRRDVSLQAMKAAFSTLRELNLTDHPSNHTLVAHENSIRLVEGNVNDPVVTDLLRKKRHHVLATVEDVMAPFVNFRGDEVVDFRRPRCHLEVVEGRMGGLPTVEGTRVPYVVIADLLRGGDVPVEKVNRYYPSVSIPSALDALDFDCQVRGDQAVVA